MYIVAHLFMSLLGKVHVGFLSSAPVWSYFFPKASPRSRQSLGVFSYACNACKKSDASEKK